MKTTDWMPGSRRGQITMASHWITMFEANGTRWQIDAAEIMILKTKTAGAEDALVIAESKERTSSTTALLETSFKDLCDYMRFIKQRKLYKPLLSNIDFADLWLTPKKETKSKIPVPVHKTKGRVEFSVSGVVIVVWEYIVELNADERSDYGVRVNYGVVVDDPAAQSALTGQHYYLSEAPKAPEQLAADFFTKRRRHAVAFPAADSGKRVWFALRVENAKGEKGPWGDMFSAIIP